MFQLIARACGRATAAFGRALPDMARDAAGLMGVELIGYGAWLVYEPAGYIVSEILVVVGVILTSFERKARAG